MVEAADLVVHYVTPVFLTQCMISGTLVDGDSHRICVDGKWKHVLPELLHCWKAVWSGG